MQIGEVLDEPGLCGTHDVADGRGVLEARDTDHDVGLSEPRDLVSDGRGQGSLGHEVTVPPLFRWLPCGQRRGIDIVAQSVATVPGW